MTDSALPGAEEDARTEGLRVLLKDMEDQIEALRGQSRKDRKRASPERRQADRAGARSAGSLLVDRVQARQAKMADSVRRQKDSHKKKKKKKQKSRRDRKRHRHEDRERSLSSSSSSSSS